MNTNLGSGTSLTAGKDVDGVVVCPRGIFRIEENLCASIDPVGVSCVVSEQAHSIKVQLGNLVQLNLQVFELIIVAGNVLFSFEGILTCVTARFRRAKSLYPMGSLSPCRFCHLS